MSYDAKTQRLISLKKLAGKAQTSNDKDLANEGLPSGLTLASNTIFGQAISTAPSNSALYTITGYVEYIRFPATFIAGSDTSDGRHGFELKLPSDYESNSTNAKAGTYPFINNQSINITSGSLQLIPPSFATDYEAKPFYGGTSAKDSGTQIPLLDARDWYLDYFNGIFFQQDPPGSGDHAENPDYVEAYLYIGNMLDVVAGGGGGGGGGDSFFTSPSNGLLNTTGSVAFAGSLGSSYTVSSVGSDTSFFVSGADGGKSLGRGVSVFGGDIQVSGAVYFGNSSYAAAWSVDGLNQLIIDGDNYLDFKGDNSVKIYVGNSNYEALAAHGVGSSLGVVINDDATSNMDFRVETANKPYAIFSDSSTDKVLILSGGASTDLNQSNFADTNFFVSGAIDSTGTSIAGSSVFGGDLVISGALAINQSAADGSRVFVTTQGRVGIGTSTPSYKLSVGGNMEVGEYIYHRNDSDTFIQFAEDAIGLTAGGEQLITLSEQVGQDIVKIGDGGDVDLQVRTLNDDNTLYVQGDTDRIGIGTNAPSSIVHIKEAGPTLTFQRENNSNASTIDFLGAMGNTANSIIHDSSTNDLVFKTFNGSAVEEIMRVGDHYGASVRQVTFLSGSNIAPPAMQPRNTSDIAFFVSGAIGSRGTSIRGTSVFGGDLYVSGNLIANGLSSSKKYAYLVTASHAATKILNIPDVDFSSNQYSFDRNDVYVNGQLMTSGSIYDYTLYGILTGSLAFTFGLLPDDIISIKQS